MGLKKLFLPYVTYGLMRLFSSDAYGQSYGALVHAETENFKGPSMFYQLKIQDQKSNTFMGFRKEINEKTDRTTGSVVVPADALSTNLTLMNVSETDKSGGNAKNSFGINATTSLDGVKITTGVETAPKQRLYSANIEKTSDRYGFSIGYSRRADNGNWKDLADASYRLNIDQFRLLHKVSVDPKNKNFIDKSVFLAGFMPVDNVAARAFIKNRSKNNAYDWEHSYQLWFLINPAVGEGWFHGTADEFFDQSIVKDLTIKPGILFHTYGEYVFDLNYKVNPSVKDFLSEVYKSFGKEDISHVGIGYGFKDYGNGKKETGRIEAGFQNEDSYFGGRVDFEEGKSPLYSLRADIGLNLGKGFRLELK